MSKKLFIIRHAKTEVPQRGQADFDRQLKPRGHKDAAAMAQALVRRGVVLDQIYVSPAQRAKQTAEIMASFFEPRLNEFRYDERIYEASRQDLLSVINDFEDQFESVFLIGHNPGLILIGDYLCPDSLDFLPTTGVLEIDFELDSWTEVSGGLGNLRWFKTPKTLLA